MDGVVLEAKVAESREAVGLSDGGKTILKCSACDEPLAEIWVTRPDVNEMISYQAECALCGDHSFVVDLKGLSHIGHIENGKVDMSDITSHRCASGKTIHVIKTAKRR